MAEYSLHDTLTTNSSCQLQHCFTAANSCYELMTDVFAVQKLDLQKVSHDEHIDCSNVRGQIVISLAGRDRGGSGPNNTDVSLLSESADDCCSRLSPEIIPRRDCRLPQG